MATHKEFKDGMTVVCKVGDVTKFELASNPTTGYRWMILIANDGRVGLEKNEYVPSNPQLIGSGGIHHIWLKANRAGKSTLKMENCAPAKQNPDGTLIFDISA